MLALRAEVNVNFLMQSTINKVSFRRVEKQFEYPLSVLAINVFL